MPTEYEVGMYCDIERIARALERIASVMEGKPSTVPELERVKAELLAEAAGGTR
jgi:hypothetical protein